MGGGVHIGWVRGRVLGRGSTATVFLAARATPGGTERFAVKSAELSRSATLQREARILSSLCSPHVASCLGSDVTAEPDGRVLYNLFVEYVPGGSLSDEIKWRSSSLEEQRIRLYTRGILGGLAYLHSVGLAHCDVKGQNVLLCEEGASTKLADLGCARWVSGHDDDDIGLVISGTPMYMAPEVARGDEQGTAADIWALGCTVIEMETGRPPWGDVADPVAAIHRIAFSADVPDFPCNVSDDARDFLGRCLKRDPRERWSAEQLLSHPFVSGTGEFTVECKPEPKKMGSPTSTLDQFFWDSWAEKGVEEHVQALVEDCHQEPPQERLRQLLGGSNSLPPAAASTWHDGCWITIRGGAEVGYDKDGSSVSPAADSCEYDAISTAVGEPSTSTAWSAETTADCQWGGESTDRRGRGVGTLQGGLLSNPHCECFISDDTAIRSCTELLPLDQGDFVVDRHVCYSLQITKQERRSIDFDYDDLDDLKIFAYVPQFA